MRMSTGVSSTLGKEREFEVEKNRRQIAARDVSDRVFGKPAAEVIAETAPGYFTATKVRGIFPAASSRLEAMKRERLVAEEVTKRIGRGVAQVVLESLPLDQGIVSELAPSIIEGTSLFVESLINEDVIPIRSFTSIQFPLGRRLVGSLVRDGVSPVNEEERAVVSKVVLGKAKKALKSEIETAKKNTETLDSLTEDAARIPGDQGQLGSLPPMRRNFRGSGKAKTEMGTLIHESCRKVAKELGSLNMDRAIGEAVVAFCTFETLKAIGAVDGSSSDEVFSRVKGF
jgi:hypothetical protein